MCVCLGEVGECVILIGTGAIDETRVRSLPPLSLNSDIDQARDRSQLVIPLGKRECAGW